MVVGGAETSVVVVMVVVVVFSVVSAVSATMLSDSGGVSSSVTILDSVRGVEGLVGTATGSTSAGAIDSSLEGSSGAINSSLVGLSGL